MGEVPVELLRGRIARALFVRDREAVCEPMTWDECDDGLMKHYWLGMADAVLAALGLEVVPTLAISVTDEHIEGVPFSVHRKVGDPFCGDESICAQHEPVYRLAGLLHPSALEDET